MPRSSTSSSERRSRLPVGFPWAGALALGIVLLLDRGILGWATPWESLDLRIPATHMAEKGTVRDQLAKIQLSTPTPHVCVFGSSRAQADFDTSTLETHPLPGISFAKFAHPGLLPLELRSLVAEIDPSRCRVAVLVLSEFEIYSPLELRPQTFSGSLRALTELVRLTDLQFVWDQREAILQLATNALLLSYRWRRVFHSLGLEVEFPIHPPLVAPRDPLQAFFRPADRTPVPPRLEREIRRRLAGQLSPSAAFAFRFQLSQIRSLRDGPHALVQREFLRGIVESFQAAGSQVLIAEAPLIEPAGILYPARLRSEFRSFAAKLARDENVAFASLAEGPKFQDADFQDLTHLGPAGAKKFTQWVAERLSRIPEL
ncbi:SGNH/GDSL hydrolase family protein [Myxococcota bacterium]|nr:SGNH/GDSL hydrolase family protein [Myxococcota bacterium]